MKIKSYFKKFINIGLDNQTNRVVWLENALKKVPAGGRILDAGAGELQFKKFCTHLRYISQDFAQYNGIGDGSGLQTNTWDNSRLDIVSDITEIPEPNNSFDAIMCVEVFEHIPNPVAAIKEFSRLLKKDGLIIITAPFCSLTHFSPYHFCSGFNRYFYKKNLSDFGFDIIEITPNGNYFDYIAQELRRISSVSDQYSKKSNSFLLKIFVYSLLILLNKFSKNDRGSSELLCFGYHVIARKK